MRWIRRLCLLAAVAGVTLWVHLFEFNGLPEWDSAGFLAIGKLLQRGLLLYRDLWDTKPPGIYVYQTLVYSVLPIEVWSLRLTDYVLYVGAGLLFFRLCRLLADWPLAAGATALWLYFSHHPSFNIAGFYTEEYSSIAAVAALAAAARYWRRGGLAWVAVSGLAAAVAVIFKHPGAACGVPAVILLSGRRPLRALPLFALSGALPILAVVGYFWWHAALDAFLDCQFLHLLKQHGVTAAVAPPLDARLRELIERSYARLAPYPAVLWPALFGAAVCLLRPTRMRLAALLWLLADLSFIAAQKFYYEHYFIQLFPAAILVGLAGAAWLLQPRRGEHWALSLPRLAAAAALLVLAWPGLREAVERRQLIVGRAWATLRAGPAAWPRHPGGAFDAELGDYLRQRTAPDDRIFIFETGTRLAVYWTADRLPASRYVFSIVTGSNPARQAEQLAELERTRPAYVMITGNSVFRYFTPYLLANYTLADVKFGGNRVELWVRTQPAALAAGTLAGLADDPVGGGLALPQAAPSAGAPLREEPAGAEQRGTWTSPVIEVVPGGAPLALDWSPRADLAANPGGLRFPSAESSVAYPLNDPQAVFGVPTHTGRWSTVLHQRNQTLTINLGFTAIADRIVLRSSLTSPAALRDGVRLVGGAAGAVAPIDGTWELGEGSATLRFAPRPLAALRLEATPDGPMAAITLQRVLVPAVGMGVAVRYRTGPTPDLAAVPWVAVNDEEGQRVIDAQRYVQVECEVWSRYPGYGPVLRTVQIGRLRFQRDAAATPPQIFTTEAQRHGDVALARPAPNPSATTL